MDPAVSVSVPDGAIQSQVGDGHGCNGVMPVDPVSQHVGEEDASALAATGDVVVDTGGQVGEDEHAAGCDSNDEIPPPPPEDCK